MDIHMNYGNHEKSEAYVYRKFGPLKIRWRVWTQWYKNNTNGCRYKILVLFGLRKSPTFDQLYWFEKYKDSICSAFYYGFLRGYKTDDESNRN